MRNLDEVNINEGGEPVRTASPNDDDFRQFENYFGVELPQDYKIMLRHANGGHPEADSFTYYDGKGEDAVDTFYQLNGDQDDLDGVWKNTIHLRKVLDQAGLNSNVVAIGQNGGGDQVFLRTSAKPPSVHILYRTDGNSIPKVADSFAEFIDALYIDPDYV